MDTDKKAKMSQLHLRVDKDFKDKIMSICRKNHHVLSRVITTLLHEYIIDMDMDGKEIMVKIPIDQLEYARINLYALEHETTVEDLMLNSTLEKIRGRNRYEYE